MKPSVLITGASGFLGSWLFNHFHSHGYSTFGVDRSRPCTAGIFRIAAENCYCLKIPSIRFYSLLASVRPSVIIHAAGPSSVSASVADPESDFHDSVSVTEFLLQCIRRYSSRSALVYLSSAAVYGNPPGLPVSESMPCQPISPYGRHKQICEQMIQDFSQHYDVPCAVLRIFSAYGEGLRRQVIYDICSRVCNPEESTVAVYGTGEETRDFIHASDVARVVEQVIAAGSRGVFNVASGTKTTIAEIAHLIIRSFRSTKPVQYTHHIREGDPLYWQADISRLATIGFHPAMSFLDGITAYCKWITASVQGTRHDTQYSRRNTSGRRRMEGRRLVHHLARNRSRLSTAR